MPSAQKAYPDRPGLTELGYSERYECQVIGLNRSTLRRYLGRRPSNQEVRKTLLPETIGRIHEASRATYGVRRR